MAWDHAGEPGDWTFAHEIGHNLGLEHHDDDNDFCSSYAHGHRWEGESGTEWRDIMDRHGSPIQHFSNPEVLWDEVPTGIQAGQPDDSDSKRSFSEQDQDVWSYRESLASEVWLDFGFDWPFRDGSFNFPFQNLAEAMDRVRWEGRLRIKSSSTTAGFTFARKAVTVQAEDGTVVIGAE